MGDAPDTLTLREICDLVREQIGPNGERLQHTCDVIVEEVCRCWPEKAMADLAKDVKAPGSGDAAIDALLVTVAKVRENIEARWDCKASERHALDLVLRACVMEFATLWFSSVEARIAMRAVIALVRRPKT